MAAAKLFQGVALAYVPPVLRFDDLQAEKETEIDEETQEIRLMERYSSGPVLI